MKTLAVIGFLGLLVSITACSSGDAGRVNGEMRLGSSIAYEITPDCLDYDMDGPSCAAFRATNAQRIVHGLPAFQYCRTCTAMAEEQSKDMNDRGYFDHNRPNGETFSQRTARFGLSKGSGENIAWGKLGDEVVGLWMDSPGHRANILNPNYKSLGVGTYNLYTTQVFYAATDR